MVQSKLLVCFMLLQYDCYFFFQIFTRLFAYYVQTLAIVSIGMREQGSYPCVFARCKSHANSRNQPNKRFTCIIFRFVWKYIQYSIYPVFVVFVFLFWESRRTKQTNNKKKRNDDFHYILLCFYFQLHCIFSNCFSFSFAFIRCVWNSLDQLILGREQHERKKRT